MLRVLLSILLLIGLAGPLRAADVPDFSAIAGDDAEEFLPVEQAFRLKSEAAGNAIRLEWKIAAGYALYKDRLAIGVTRPAGVTLAPLSFQSPSVFKQDPSFGRVAVFHDRLEATLALERVPAAAAGKPVELWVRYQGCADAGLCYPPQDQLLTFGKVLPAAVVPASTGNSSPLKTESSRLTQLFIMFALGLGLAFTPCVLPMLPILAGIVARQHTSSALRGLGLALAYVLGVATVYALLGALVGLFGQQVNLPGWFQKPAVLLVFAGLFVALALSLFGLYELRLPVAITSHFHARSSRQQGGALAGSYVMGLFSALVVSPCVSAPLVGVLLHISATGDAGFGAVALFLLALGMGVPLLVLGASEGRLLPKAGAWMHEVKVFFGLLLLFVAAELLTRLLPAPLALVLYGLCTGAVAWWLWRLLPSGHRLRALARGVAVAVLAWSLALLAGGAAGGDDPLRPLAVFARDSAAARPTAFIRIKTGANLDREIAAARAEGRPLMLDFYADWCVSCKVMEREVFRRPAVAARMAALRLVQADVTANDAEDRALLARFELLGPPTILFFGPDGRERRAARLVGETDADGFLRHLDQHGL